MLVNMLGIMSKIRIQLCTCFAQSEYVYCLFNRSPDLSIILVCRYKLPITVDGSVQKPRRVRLNEVTDHVEI